MILLERFCFFSSLNWLMLFFASKIGNIGDLVFLSVIFCLFVLVWFDEVIWVGLVGVLMFHADE